MWNTIRNVNLILLALTGYLISHRLRVEFRGTDLVDGLIRQDVARSAFQIGQSVCADASLNFGRLTPQMIRGRGVGIFRGTCVRASAGGLV